MEQELVDIDETHLKILATQLGIVFPGYDLKMLQEEFPTTDPAPRFPEHLELTGLKKAA